MIDITGTKNQQLIMYVDRVFDYLGLGNYDCYFELEFKSKCDGDAGGFAYGDDETVIVEIARNDACGKIPMKDMMINIAHELVHAEQLASGRLLDGGMVMRKKDGEDVLSVKRIYEGKTYIDVPYDDQPWEIEAYKMEKSIYEACK